MATSDAVIGDVETVAGAVVSAAAPQALPALAAFEQIVASIEDLAQKARAAYQAAQLAKVDAEIAQMVADDAALGKA